MKPAQKGAIVHLPTILTTAEMVQTCTWDCRGFDFAVVDILLGTANAAHTPLLTVELTECDTTVVSSFSAIAGFTGGTSVVSGSTGFIIPTNDNGAVVEFVVDLKKRLRYLSLDLKAPTTTYYHTIGALVRLSGESESKDNTTTKWVTNLDNTDATSLAILVSG